MFALLKQYRELVVTVVLLVLPFGTYLSHAKHGRNLNRVDRVVLAATGPIENGVNGVVYWAIDKWGDYVALRGVRDENLHLRQRVEHLQSENAQLQEAKLENERLRQLLDFSRAQPTSAIVAQVVGTGLAPTFMSIRVSRGEADGVRKGMAAVTPIGVVGKVQEVGPHEADVLLITDTNSAVAVESQRSRARATVRGGGEGKRCKLDFAERSALFDDGDLLVTSGTDGVFPKGIPVGRVTHLDRKRVGVNLAGDVEPAVDLSTAEELLLLAPTATESAPLPAAQADKTDKHDKLEVLKAGVVPP